MKQLTCFAAIAMGIVGAVRPALCQGRGFDFAYGAWQPDSESVFWSVGYYAPLVRSLDYGVALSRVDRGRSPVDRSLTGAEVTVGVGRDGSGPYFVASGGLGFRHYDHSLDAFWSAGGGAAARLLPFLSIGIEGRFRAEDEYHRGFWRLAGSDRVGFSVAARVAFVWRAARRTSGSPPPAPPRLEPPPLHVERAAQEVSGSSDSGALAAEVVITALNAMGSPYRWGGAGANGYDCSGLIQFSYGQHGIILPRTGYEQARLGVSVDRRVDALHPGDVLGFAVEGNRVTHVGLYVGEGQFIHSATGGVRLSSLSAMDPDSEWWQQRWIVVRRILQ